MIGGTGFGGDGGGGDGAEGTGGGDGGGGGGGGGGVGTTTVPGVGGIGGKVNMNPPFPFVLAGEEGLGCDGSVSAMQSPPSNPSCRQFKSMLWPLMVDLGAVPSSQKPSWIHSTGAQFPAQSNVTSGPTQATMSASLAQSPWSNSQASQLRLAATPPTVYSSARSESGVWHTPSPSQASRTTLAMQSPSQSAKESAGQGPASAPTVPVDMAKCCSSVVTLVALKPAE
mmetsp:Transcript_7850/g.29044  ORF Transcript_7850/g.29044 Transcript_7850/m.29044 type:complete len:227 (-) Transcript_7850:260-940(-)